MGPLVDAWIHLARLAHLPPTFQYAFVARGLLAVLLMAPLLGGLSHLVVARRLAFFSTALGMYVLAKKVRRSICMSALIVPVLFFYAFILI